MILPFPDASFDAAFAANVLEHLTDPLRALREIRRVLRSGGVVGVRDPDVSTQRVAGLGPAWEKVYPAVSAARERANSPTYAPRQRALLRQAGFAPLEATAIAECRATPEALRLIAGVYRDALGQPATAALVAPFGLGPADLEAARAELVAWPDQPDAIQSMTHFAAVGRAAG
jgi:SAM-dependent methyltransferase